MHRHSSILTFPLYVAQFLFSSTFNFSLVSVDLFIQHSFPSSQNPTHHLHLFTINPHYFSVFPFSSLHPIPLLLLHPYKIISRLIMASSSSMFKVTVWFMVVLVGTCMAQSPAASPPAPMMLVPVPPPPMMLVPVPPPPKMKAPSPPMMLVPVPPPPMMAPPPMMSPPPPAPMMLVPPPPMMLVPPPASPPASPPMMMVPVPAPGNPDMISPPAPAPESMSPSPAPGTPGGVGGPALPPTTPPPPPPGSAAVVSGASLTMLALFGGFSVLQLLF